MSALILYICGVILFTGLIAGNIVLSIMLKSNKSGSSKGVFYQNTEEPMNIHVFTFSEYCEDMKENPQHYGAINLF